MAKWSDTPQGRSYYVVHLIPDVMETGHQMLEDATTLCGIGPDVRDIFTVINDEDVPRESWYAVRKFVPCPECYAAAGLGHTVSRVEDRMMEEAINL